MLITHTYTCMHTHNQIHVCIHTYTDNHTIMRYTHTSIHAHKSTLWNETAFGTHAAPSAFTALFALGGSAMRGPDVAATCLSPNLSARKLFFAGHDRTLFVDVVTCPWELVRGVCTWNAMTWVARSSRVVAMSFFFILLALIRSASVWVSAYRWRKLFVFGSTWLTSRYHFEKCSTWSSDG